MELLAEQEQASVEPLGEPEGTYLMLQSLLGFSERTVRVLGRVVVRKKEDLSVSFSRRVVALVELLQGRLGKSGRGLPPSVKVVVGHNPSDRLSQHGEVAARSPQVSMGPVPKMARDNVVAEVGFVLRFENFTRLESLLRFEATK